MKPPLRIVADDKIPFLRTVLDQVADVTYLPGKEISKADVRMADALITRTRTRCDRNLLEGSAVRFIASATIGFDHIDTAYCKALGITWTNAPGCNSASVAQYLLSVLLTLAADGWELEKQTIGIVGVGNVGKKVARLAETLGLRVLLNDPPRERLEGTGPFVSLEQIQAESTIITFHVPLTMAGQDNTFHLAGPGFFEGLEHNPWIINTSRGEVVDTSAIKVALSKHQIEGAILDVWENEPEIDLELLDLSRIATPHIAGYSQDGKANGTSMSVQALSRFFGLGLDNWYPADIPGPSNSLISLDGRGMARTELIAKAALQSYDVMGDDERLRRSLSSFERLRGDYPVRREPSSWKVDIRNGSDDAALVLEHLGFQVHRDSNGHL